LQEQTSFWSQHSQGNQESKGQQEDAEENGKKVVKRLNECVCSDDTIPRACTYREKKTVIDLVTANKGRANPPVSYWAHVSMFCAF
jgi:hypothetical protein